MKLNEVTKNDKVMFNEDMADIVKAIFKAWDRAKGMDIDVDSFSKHVEKYVEGALQDID